MDDLRTPLRRPEPKDISENERAEFIEEQEACEPEADSGPKERIEDPVGVLRMALLQERIARIRAEQQTRPPWFEARVAHAIRQIQEERARKMTELAQEESETTAEIKMHQEFLAQKHGIDLSLYSYDDSTGTLLLLPQ